MGNGNRPTPDAARSGQAGTDQRSDAAGDRGRSGDRVVDASTMAPPRAGPADLATRLGAPPRVLTQDAGGSAQFLIKRQHLQRVQRAQR